MYKKLYIAAVKPRHDIRSSVRQHRLALDMTQQELADRVGVTRQTILSVEKGKYTPSVALALSLAEVLEVGVEELFRLDRAPRFQRDTGTAERGS